MIAKKKNEMERKKNEKNDSITLLERVVSYGKVPPPQFSLLKIKF